MTDKAEFERLLDVYGFRCERFGQDLSTHARAQVVSAFAALASAPEAGEAHRPLPLGVVLGLGEYIIQTTATGEPAQIVFSQASDHDRATRTIGDIKVGGHGPFDHSRIRGQIMFTSAASLEALEAQLRELRKEHWPETLYAGPQASAEDVRNAVETCAKICDGRSASLMQSGMLTASNEAHKCGMAIRSRANELLSLTQADKDGGQQRAGDAVVAEALAHLRTLAEFGGTLEQAKSLAARGVQRCAALSATQAGQGERD